MSKTLNDFKYGYVVNMDEQKDSNGVKFNHYTFTVMMRNQTTREWNIPTISDQQSVTMVRYFTDTQVLNSQTADKEKHTKMVDELRADPDKFGALYGSVVIPINAGNPELILKQMEHIVENEQVRNMLVNTKDASEALAVSASIKNGLIQNNLLKESGNTSLRSNIVNALGSALQGVV